MAYDTRASSLPNWLASWSATGDIISTSDGDCNLKVYSKGYSAGNVTLGGNKASGASGANANYIVIGVPTVSYKVASNTPTWFVVQNAPNPFNAQTRITYELPMPSLITLSIYDLLGQKIVTLAEGYTLAGKHTVLWAGKNSVGQAVGSGLYFARLEAQGQVRTAKLMLLR